MADMAADEPRAENVTATRIDLEFDDNRLVPLLYGEHDRYLARIEAALGVQLASRGNHVAVAGEAEAAKAAAHTLNALWERICNGMDVGTGEVDAAIRIALDRLADSTPSPARQAARASLTRPGQTIRTRRGPVSARSPAQAAYLQAMREHDLVFGLGPAGTGKTWAAVAVAVSMLLSGEVSRLILSRPAVEAGERLGFLPGDMREKVDPYMRPIYDALYDMLPLDQVARRIEAGEIEVAPLAFMRGRTLSKAFIILDEAQNTTPGQMKMALTRMGAGSRMVVTGDMSQIDLPPGQTSGLRDALDIVDGMPGVSICRFGKGDVVRHGLVSRIVAAYEARTAGQKNEARTADQSNEAHTARKSVSGAGDDA